MPSPASSKRLVHGRGGDNGQATIELALCLPLVVLLLFGIVQVAVVVADQLAVQLAARQGARAASVSPSPSHAGSAAAEAATQLSPLAVSTTRTGDLVRVTVRYVDHTTVPLIGRLLPDVMVQATVVMLVEPP